MLSLATVALLTTVSSIFDIATSWLYGAIINSTKPLKWGRYRSWLMVITWLLPVTSFLLYCRIGKSEAVATVFFFIAMISIVAKTPDDRIHMSSTRATWNNASKFIWSYVGVPFLAILAGVVGEQYS